MSIVRDGFRGLYRSGAYFTEGFLPRALEKTGLRRGDAARAGLVGGVLAGAASVFIGVCFLAAIPISFPMFMVASAVMATTGKLLAAGATLLLGGTGTVVTTTGFGMCRAVKDAAKSLFKKTRPPLAPQSAPPPAPEKSLFRRMNFAPAFKKAKENRMVLAEQKCTAAPTTPQPS